MPNLADLRKPLRKLTSEKIKFMFTKEHEEQVRFIKSQCINLPKLKLPLDNEGSKLPLHKNKLDSFPTLRRRQ